MSKLVEISFYVPGPPVGKARPRVTRTHTYTPQGTKDYEALVRRSFVAPGYVPYDGAVILDLHIECPIPKSTSKKNRKLMLDGSIRPIKKPDIDNIIKIIGDALNGVAYVDDKQIVAVRSEKYYSETPGVLVEIMSID